MDVVEFGDSSRVVFKKLLTGISGLLIVSVFSSFIETFYMDAVLLLMVVLVLMTLFIEWLYVKRVIGLRITDNYIKFGYRDSPSEQVDLAAITAVNVDGLLCQLSTAAVDYEFDLRAFSEESRVSIKSAFSKLSQSK